MYINAKHDSVSNGSMYLFPQCHSPVKDSTTNAILFSSNCLSTFRNSKWQFFKRVKLSCYRGATPRSSYTSSSECSTRSSYPEGTTCHISTYERSFSYNRSYCSHIPITYTKHTYIPRTWSWVHKNRIVLSARSRSTSVGRIGHPIILSIRRINGCFGLPARRTDNLGRTFVG